jgi:hypothetical protein
MEFTATLAIGVSETACGCASGGVLLADWKSENELPPHPPRARVEIPITASTTAKQWRRAAAASLVVTVTSPFVL